MIARSIRFAFAGVCACLALASTAAGAADTFGSVHKPFAATSPWNSRPVAPVLGDTTIPKSDYFPNVGENAFAVPVFSTDAQDPPVTIYGVSDPNGVFDPDEERTRSVTLPHWPPGVTPASGSDGHAEVVDTAMGVVHSFWQLRKTANRWTAALYAWAPLDGRGWGDPAHYYQGARAAGVPSIGGLIRKHEVDDGDTMYRHALAASLTFNGLASDPVYIYPATSADSGAAKQNSGRIPEGALLMLPAGFDVQQIGTPALRKVAETLKVYGTYVVDRNEGTPYFIYAEIGSGLFLMKRGWNNDVATDLDKIRVGLRQVVSTGGWLDGNGKPYTPEKIFNVLSMRGPWQVESGDAPGNYETWKQAVVFPKTSATRTVMVNFNGRALTQTTWALPVAGASYKLSASTTGGAKLRIVLKTKVEGKLLYDSGELADGQSKTFAWPADSTVVTYAISGVGQPSSVRATLIAVDRKVDLAPTTGPAHGG